MTAVEGACVRVNVQKIEQKDRKMLASNCCLLRASTFKGVWNVARNRCFPGGSDGEAYNACSGNKTNKRPPLSVSRSRNADVRSSALRPDVRIRFTSLCNRLAFGFNIPVRMFTVSKQKQFEQVKCEEHTCFMWIYTHVALGRGIQLNAAWMNEYVMKLLCLWIGGYDFVGFLVFRCCLEPGYVFFMGIILHI